jgi:ectoine hydroxylase-related dioxygenase (phytanoyl-CoA dioxygenase family)
MDDEGFAILSRVFAEREVAAVAEALARWPLDRSRAGARHLLSCPAVSSLARDPRLLAIAARALGGEVWPFGATLFDKSAGANWLVVWHQDTALPLRDRREVPGWGPWSVKRGVIYAHAPATTLSRLVALRVHLDDSTDTNGPLRVLPGSHGLGVLSDAQIHDLASSATPVACVAPRGSVVLMRPLLVHSSSKGMTTAARRVVHIEYAASVALEAGLELRATADPGRSTDGSGHLG